MEQDADYIVVGAGAAGCVISARLAEQGFRVLLLEAGGEDTSPLFRIPGLGFMVTLDERRNWNFQTEPVAALNDRRLTIFQGKVAGGSSSINGMMYNRGSPAACSPFTTQWVQDSYATAKTLARAIVNQGGDSWFFIAADYVYGASLVTDTTAILDANGGKVVGVVRAPLGTSDFSSFLLQAQASGAKVVALANGGADTINCIKQADEFGLRQGGQKLAALNFMDPDAKSLGLAAAQGTLFSAAFYWDRTDLSRAWSRRFYAHTQRMPTPLQAGVYSQITHYLKAVQKTGAKDAAAVAAAMREMPVSDMFAQGIVRADGRMVHDMYLAQVKTPAQSKEPWDQFNLLQTVSGAEAFRPLAAGGCKLAT